MGAYATLSRPISRKAIFDEGGKYEKDGKSCVVNQSKRRQIVLFTAHYCTFYNSKPINVAAIGEDAVL